MGQYRALEEPGGLSVPHPAGLSPGRLQQVPSVVHTALPGLLAQLHPASPTLQAWCLVPADPLSLGQGNRLIYFLG